MTRATMVAPTAPATATPRRQPLTNLLIPTPLADPRGRPNRSSRWPRPRKPTSPPTRQRLVRTRPNHGDIPISWFDPSRWVPRDDPIGAVGCAGKQYIPIGSIGSCRWLPGVDPVGGIRRPSLKYIPVSWIDCGRWLARHDPICSIGCPSEHDFPVGG